MPTAGVHYPASYAQMRAWFPDDAACMDYLDWLRWPTGSVCRACGVVGEPRRVRGRVWHCSACEAKLSRTAGTIFQDTRTPLTTWFQAAWLMTTDKGGMSAKSLQRQFGIGSYQTAWTMLHRYRAAMSNSGTDLLTGRVEVDETVYGGSRPGPPGRGALGKVLIGIAVELPAGKGFGRARMRVLPDASSASLGDFLLATVEPGSTVVTDGWSSDPSAVKTIDGEHVAFNIKASGLHAHELLPAVHRIASLFKRWVLGTHQGSLGNEHIPAYLDEFVFRFNRRHSKAPGMLFYRLMSLAANTDPVTYRSLVKVGAAKATPPPGLAGPRRSPRTLALPEEDRPWRAAEEPT